MKKRIQELAYRVDTLFCMFIFGLVYGIPLGFNIALGRIHIHHYQRFPKLGKEGKIFVINHTTLLEPPLCYLLFIRGWILGIIRAIRRFSFAEIYKLIPISTPDKKNYYDPWYLIWMKPFAVAIDRNEGAKGIHQRAIAFRQLARLIVEKKRSVILPPEGGRTHKQKEKMVSPKGNVIGKFKPGTGALGIKTKTEIVPIGFKGTEKVLPNNYWAFFLLFLSPILMLWRGPIEINIGHSLRFSKENPRTEADQKIAQALLETLDEISYPSVSEG